MDSIVEHFASSKCVVLIIAIAAVIYGFFFLKFLSPAFDKIEEDGRTELLEIRKLEEQMTLVGKPHG